MRVTTFAATIVALVAFTGCSSESADLAKAKAQADAGELAKIKAEADARKPDFKEADPRVFNLGQCVELEKQLFTLCARFDDLKAEFDKLVAGFLNAQLRQDDLQRNQIALQEVAVQNQMKILQNRTEEIEKQICALPWRSLAGKSRADLVQERGILYQQISTLTVQSAIGNSHQAAKADAASRRLERIRAIDSYLQ